MKKKFTILTTLALLGCMSADAQLSSNKDKFLGNITTSYQVDYGKEKFYTLWNQITPENESKWDAIEGSGRGSFSFGGADNAYNYAKQHNFPFKYHCLIWGAQYPKWVNSLSKEEQYKAIEEYMDAVKKHYPELPMIDVVNEAIAGHQPAPYKAALGGDGKTGYDWIIKAFEMAHERWPDAILIYNDYNTFRWQKTEFINLVRTLRDAGAPIDAYGCQSHDLTDMKEADFKAAMNEIQSALKMPMYSTEYDIGTSDDALQLQRYKEQIPFMWEADYVAGITLWGYIYGRTWTTDGNSGIIKDGKDRPAMEWLRDYMASETAKTAKSPFPGMEKEASVYVKPAAIAVTKGEAVPVTVRARLKTKTIDHIELYVNDKLFTTMTEAPYATEFTPETQGRYNLKAVVYATDGTTFERLSGVTAYNPRSPYKDLVATLPGTIEAENFDAGAEGMSYHDTDTKDEGDGKYRTNGGGVDIVKGNGGFAIGYTNTGEWLEYTVDVAEAGTYAFDAVVSSGATNSSFSLALNTDEGLTDLTPSIAVPCITSNDWNTYSTVHGRLSLPLEAGRQIIRINITGANCNIDKIKLQRIDVDENIKVAIAADPAPATVGEPATIAVDASSAASTIAKVNVYVNDVLLKAIDAAPFEAQYKPKAKGTYKVTAEAVDADGKVSTLAAYNLTVNNKRSPYRNNVTIPGIVEAENFDRGGEGLTFHDSDSNDEAKSGYRSDNEGVDIKKTSGGGYVLGWTSQNEWYEYTVEVTQAGKYTCHAVVSSGISGTGFNVGIVENGKVTNLWKMDVRQTGNNSWDNYKTINNTTQKELAAGKTIIRITIYGANCDIDKIELKSVEPTAINEINADKTDGNGATYNISGQRVDDSYKGIVIINGKKMMKK